MPQEPQSEKGDAAQLWSLSEETVTLPYIHLSRPNIFCPLSKAFPDSSSSLSQPGLKIKDQRPSPVALITGQSPLHKWLVQPPSPWIKKVPSIPF